MRRLLPALDTAAAALALKSAAAVVAGWWVGLWFDWRVGYIGTTVVMLQTATFGATLVKSLLRIGGAVAGSALALGLLGACGQERDLFIAAVALCVGVGLYVMQGTPYGYAWLVSLMTLLAVGFASAAQPAAAFELAVSWTSGVCLGVLLVLLVHGVLWPVRAGDTFERQLREFVKGCQALVALTRTSLVGDGGGPDAEARADRAKIQAVVRMRQTLAEAAVDTAHYRRYRAAYDRLIDYLYSFLLTHLALRDALEARRSLHPDTPKLVDEEALRAALAAVAAEMDDLADELAAARPAGEGRGPPRERPARPAFAPVDTGPLGLAHAAFITSLKEQVDRLAAHVADLRRTVAEIGGPPPPPPPRPAPEGDPLRGDRFRKAVLGALVVTLAGWVWLLTDWPRGPDQFMMYSAVTIAYFAFYPVLPPRAIFRSLLIGPAVGGLLYFAVMPALADYAQLAPVLLLVLFPLCYLINSPDVVVSKTAFYSALWLDSLIALSQHQTYSFGGFVNAWLGLAGAFGLGLGAIALLFHRVPEREFTAQLRGYFAGCRDRMLELEARPPWTPEGLAVILAGRQRWLDRLGRLGLWSGLIDYRRVPGNDRRAADALLDAVQSMTFRLETAQRARADLGGHEYDPFRHHIAHARDVCAEALRRLEAGLAAPGPVAELPRVRADILELEAEVVGTPAAAPPREVQVRVMIVAIYYFSLSVALHRCRDAANAIDWRAWDENHF